MLKGESLDALPAPRARSSSTCASLEIRDTLAPRREHAVDAARFAALNVRSALVCGFSPNGRVRGFIGLCLVAAAPATAGTPTCT